MTLLQQVEVEGRLVDVRLDGEHVRELGELSPGLDEQVIDGKGGALIPGLHDHHLHLLALAAAEESVDVSAGLHALRDRTGTGWLRGIGWRDHGDRFALDAIVTNRPVRVQHRSGALWTVNSRGSDDLGLSNVELDGVERDELGAPTGRLWRLDSWLSERLGRDLPDLPAVGRQLARLGVTGVTDATPDLDEDTCVLLRNSIPQRLLLLGDPQGSGPVKIVLPDHELPSLDDVCALVSNARPRPVAVHCVSRESLVLLITALDIVGRLPRDRVEHASVTPQELLHRLPLCVTQPAFLFAHGDDYLDQIPQGDLTDLYRYRSILDAGGSVVPSSDAPFGPLDPWQVLLSAQRRTSASGQALSISEHVSGQVALEGLLRPLEDPTGPVRRVHPNQRADLTLLHVPLHVALAEGDARAVRATWIGGTMAFG